MLAARYYKGRKNVGVEEIPKPSVGRNDVLVKIQGIGVCHSDLHLIKETFTVNRYPVTLGHEGSGVVEEVGQEVKDLKSGDRVALFYVAICGECAYCITGRENLCDKMHNLGFDLDGTWAEYVVVPSRSIIKMPDGMPFDQAALAGCAVVTAFHANLVGEVRAGKSVAVIGVGGVGFHGIEWSRLFGAAPVIAVDINEHKLRKAKEAGADCVVNAKEENPVEAIRKLTDGTGVDVAFEYIGLKQTIEQAIAATKKGGISVMVGISNSRIEIDALDFLGKGGQLRAVQNHTRDQMKTVLNLMHEGRIDISKSISQRLPLKEADKAIDALREQTGNPIRIVLTP